MLKRRVDALEQALQNDGKVFVVCFTSENSPEPTEEELEAARKKALAEGRQVVFLGELERWSK